MLPITQTAPPTVETETAKCLLVEDDPTVSRLLATRMGLEGYHVRTCADGAEVLAAVSDWRPDIIVLDLMLPSVNGLELCRLLKTPGSWSSHIPVMVVTAYSSSDTRRAALDAGADEFVPKPFNGQQLSVRIRQLVASGRQDGSGAAGAGA
ncbi:MAG: response regulator transcription factor [Candidatus Dormibacteria bacterium]